MASKVTDAIVWYQKKVSFLFVFMVTSGKKKKKKLAYCFLCVKYNKCKVVLHCWLVFYERE